MCSKKRHRTTSSTGNPGPRPFFRVARFVLAVLIVWGHFGCYSDPIYREVDVPVDVMVRYLQGIPPALHPFYRDILRQGPRNLVLNHMRAGLAAMELGEYEFAERSFDIALRHIESVYADNENARKARSLWYEEGSKDFKGEPYERAMAYYYRGLLYLRRGDFENARACFKGGQLQDALAEQAVYRADFALLMFLEGWASHLLGDRDMAEEAFQEVKKYRPDFSAPAEDHNALLIAETGKAPVKVAEGRGQSELRFREGTGFWEKRAQFDTRLGEFPAYPMEDIYWQASTRGGRQVDKILAGKVHFKESQETMGRALTGISLQALAMTPHMGDEAPAVAAVAGVVGVVGLAQQALAARTRTRADTRYWDNLPDAVHVATFRAGPHDQPVAVSFFDRDGYEIPDLRTRGTLEFFQERWGLAWVRSRSALIH